MTKIIRHPENWSPDALLRETLKESGDIESVVILTKYKDGSYGRTWSKQGLKELVFKCKLLEQSIWKLLDNGEQ